MKRQFSRYVALFAAVALLVAGCSLIERQAAEDTGGGWIDWESGGDWEGGEFAAVEGGMGGGGGGGGGGGPGEVAEETLGYAAPPPEPAVDGLGGGDTSAEMPATGGGGDMGGAVVARDADESTDYDAPLDSEARADVPESSYLRAGSVDDNAEWDDYLLYRRRIEDTAIDFHAFDVSERHAIAVTNADGMPVLGAKVTVYAGDEALAVMRTHADGQALFFPKASEAPDAETYRVVIEKDDTSAEYTIERNVREHAITLDARSATDPVRLDVLFLIDVTGSMSDEILQLKDNMIAISEQIAELPSQPDVRFAMTVYRDQGDSFVSRTHDFTPDVEAFTEALRVVQANGGGDYAEHLTEGLYKAIHLPEWRVHDTVSIVFLIADAPPQLHYSDGYDYVEEIDEANQRGIKVFPIASSGLDDQGEYIFRQLAQTTSGRFLFLTYGAGGNPSAGVGEDTTHHVDDFSVLSLDQMVVRIVEEELAHLTAE